MRKPRTHEISSNRMSHLIILLRLYKFNIRIPLNFIVTVILINKKKRMSGEWGSLEHFLREIFSNLAKLDGSKILNTIEQKTSLSHSKHVEPLHKLPSFRGAPSSRRHVSHMTTQACSSFFYSPSPPMRSPES